MHCIRGKGGENMETSDKELYELFLKGNQEAFEEIVIRHKDKLLYFIMRYVKNYEIAEDLAQDTFVYMLINKKEYDFKYSLKTYLYTIAKSRAINYLKREKRIVPLEEMESNETIEDTVFQNEQRGNIKNAIQKLKPEYQSAIYLADIEKLSYREIGKVLTKTLPQVKILIYRARKSLGEIIKGEECKYHG